MTIDPQSLVQVPPSRGRPWQLGLIAFLLLGLLGGGVAYYGTRTPASTAPPPIAQKSVDALTRIELPYVDPPIPPGPHRDEFRVACTVCHSPRLVFTQPILTEKQWKGVVAKMVGVYGAPLSADEEKRIVTYLVEVHGK